MTFFSIIIPTHNRPEYIIRAINSIIVQNETDHEIIVVNDGSDQPYNDFLSIHKDNVLYIVNSEKRGVSFSRNVGIEAATSEWIIFLDDDDELTPKYLEALRKRIANNKNYFFWCSVEFHQITSGNTKNVFHRRYPDFYSNSWDLYKDALSIGASFGLTVSKEALVAIGLFDTTYPVAEDTELLIRLISIGAIPCAISDIGVIKHEEHADRLTIGFSRYSHTNIYEQIFLKHNTFFKRNRKHYRWMMDWAFEVHIRSDNLIPAKRIALKMLRNCFLRSYFESMRKIYSHLFIKSINKYGKN